MTAATTTARAAHPASVAAAVVRVALAVQFAAGGLLKVTGSPAMVEMFADIGAGQWLRYLVGTCELLGGVGLVAPRVAGAAACGLVGLMIGATLTNVLVLEVSPALTLTFLAAAAVVAWARRDDVRALVPARRRRPAVG